MNPQQELTQFREKEFWEMLKRLKQNNKASPSVVETPYMDEATLRQSCSHAKRKNFKIDTPKKTFA